MRKFTLTLVEDDSDVRERLSQLILDHDKFELLTPVALLKKGLKL